MWWNYMQTHCTAYNRNCPSTSKVFTATELMKEYGIEFRQYDMNCIHVGGKDVRESEVFLNIFIK